ncbi:MAG: hypothetical protein SCARUB_01339 [Candidatus Scalindua rubra]|uniref:Uncharacterized protein n=1 Tax=Candidatus Scalindua rubra TaxID=1872076 RepID=A0A1E3XCZ5_9BACT|nr:MAG: hypothetical protein SCARUB_01339 [Candidatus Scalindua rubra]
MINYKATGKCEIAEKGWRCLGKTPYSKYDAMTTGPQMAPEEKFERWTTGEVSKETKEKLHGQENEEEQKDKLERRYDNLPPEERLRMWTE